MRKYEPIWAAIKDSATLSVSLVAPIHAHRSIIKAVRKEKNIDVGWKLLLAEQGIRYKLLDKVARKKITFYLVDISPITIDSL